MQVRTRIMNPLQAVALNEGLRCKKRLWRELRRQQLETFQLGPCTGRRARSAAVTRSLDPDHQRAHKGHRAGSRKMPGSKTADDASRGACVDCTCIHSHHRRRFGCGKQVASYLGLVPLEDSSGDRRRLGHITKQGSSMLRFLLVEAAQVTARSLPQWRSKYLHLMMRRGRKTAKVAMARRLAVHLYWMMRQGWDYQQWIKFGSHAGQLGNRHGVQ